jgi:hypothetical protein
MKITREQLKETLRNIMREEAEYQQFFKKALEKSGKSIPDMSDEEKKDFFNKIDTAWDGKGEKKNEGNAFGAAVTAAKEKGEDSFEVGGKTYKVEEGSVNKSYVMYLAVDKKLKELEAVQKEMAKQYFAEKDEKKKAILLDKLKKGTKVLQYTRKNLNDLESNYVMNLDKDAEYQGESVNEGRAFINAAKKAKAEGKTEFEFNGKKYPVTIKD